MNPPGLTIGINYLERGNCVLGTLQAQGKALEHPEGVKAEGEKGMAAGDRALNSLSSNIHPIHVERTWLR